mmetsp:Transcript_19675/g.23604  ORF Transcript_19675/g.23604 Transcript_19675/m.23604 type:complete len:83 (+) Transcript_19675:119-367(+)
MTKRLIFAGKQLRPDRDWCRGGWAEIQLALGGLRGVCACARVGDTGGTGGRKEGWRRVMCRRRDKMFLLSYVWVEMEMIPLR